MPSVYRTSQASWNEPQQPSPLRSSTVSSLSRWIWEGRFDARAILLQGSIGEVARMVLALTYFRSLRKRSTHRRQPRGHTAAYRSDRSSLSDLRFWMNSTVALLT